MDACFCDAVDAIFRDLFDGAGLLDDLTTDWVARVSHVNVSKTFVASDGLSFRGIYRSACDQLGDDPTIAVPVCTQLPIMAGIEYFIQVYMTPSDPAFEGDAGTFLLTATTTRSSFT